MNNRSKVLYRKAVTALVRPYVRRELPGWGILYRRFVGSFERDWLWQGEPPRWVRGKLHGYRMSVRIGGWSNRHTYFLERFYDLPTQLLLKRVLRPGDCFVDIGANEGMMTLLGSHLVGDGGSVISFEPNPVPADILEGNLFENRIGNVTLHRMGLGEAGGTLPLFVPDINTGEGSFSEPTDSTSGTFVACSVGVGDTMLKEAIPRLIKIDVEGFEAQVIAGLHKTIERTKPIVTMELIARHLARAETTPTAILQWFHDAGYTTHRLGLTKRQALDLRPLTPAWRDGDYVFAHPDNPIPCDTRP